MPLDGSVLSIEWRCLTLDEQDNEKCKTSAQIFALIRNEPSTYDVLRTAMYRLKSPPIRMSSTSDQRGPIRHYIQEWNRIARNAAVRWHEPDEDGCRLKTPHRVCQAPVVPKVGRTLKHWINKNLARQLFPFLERPVLWIEPPTVPAKKRGKVKQLTYPTEPPAEVQPAVPDTYKPECITPKEQSPGWADMDTKWEQVPIGVFADNITYNNAPPVYTLEDIFGVDEELSDAGWSAHTEKKPLDMDWLTSDSFDNFLQNSALNGDSFDNFLHTSALNDHAVRAYEWENCTHAGGYNFLALGF